MNTRIVRSGAIRTWIIFAITCPGTVQLTVDADEDALPPGNTRKYPPPAGRTTEVLYATPDAPASTTFRRPTSAAIWFATDTDRVCPSNSGQPLHLLKNEAYLTAKQREQLTWLTRPSMALATTRAARWRADSNRSYHKPPETAEVYLRRWCYGAKRSRLDPIKRFAKRSKPAGTASSPGNATASATACSKAPAR